MQTTDNNGKLTPPTAPRQWTIAQIEEALSRPIPKSILKSRRQGGSNLNYIPWYKVNEILNKYAPGWTWEIISIHTTADRLFLSGRLTIPAAEGNIYREGTGTELLKEWSEKKQQMQELAYGDPSSNAESMAFRRAAARFGLGLYLYDKD
ncbi:MAG: DUF1071 domain-containing protein [Leptolyngbyaceae cyanobacterium RM1_406_9]|nr:DUF1071 domain-containing protein [Leptolyngbyaceae cyanobacterium RM1_406_9]